MTIWLPYAIGGAEALAVGVAAFLGAIPGIPAHDFSAAISFALAKALPTGAITTALSAVGAAAPAKS